MIASLAQWLRKSQTESRKPIEARAEASSDDPKEGLLDPDFIEVRELIASYDVTEHARRADDYFKAFTFENVELRKPYMGFHAQHLVTNLGVVIANLEFFPGVRVVDFGCGTGWLSQSLALMGCLPIAVDVSQQALDLGKNFTKTKYPEIVDQISYLHYDGSFIDLPDASVDRVICMDSFHHVANQDRILSEFFRILAPDGRAIFCEPGPHHSKTPDSQHAMRAFGVIENDIVIEDIWRMAQALGFKDIKLSAFAVQPLQLSFAEFETLKSPADASEVLQRTYREMLDPVYRNTRMFVLLKGETRRDSRWEDGMAGEITAQIEDNGTTYRVSGTAKNIGSAAWRPSGDGIGAVNLGLALKTETGEWQQDFQRILFLDSTLLPGEKSAFSADIEKASVSSAEIYIDLVAEGIMWFHLDRPQRLK